MKILKLITLFLFTTALLNAESIAKIPEASGICYLKKSRELIVVNDEGWIYRLTTNGKIIEKKYLGDYDFEGVVEYKNKLLLVVEDKNAILVIKKKNLEIFKKVKVKKHKKIKNSTKHGIEAITILDGTIYLSYQASHIVLIDGIKNKKVKIMKILKHGYKDISGLTVKDSTLYMISDKKNLLIKYDVKRKRTLLKVKLPKSAQEGICFDDENNIYIADDNGQVLKYTTRELGVI